MKTPLIPTLLHAGSDPCAGNDPLMPTAWRLATPAASGRSAAIGVFHLFATTGSELESALDRLDITSAPLGGVRLRSFGGFDRGIVARPTDRVALLMPHGGRAVLDCMVRWLAGAGVREARALGPDDEFPEGATPLQSRVLAALARAASPLAIDLLLDQARRWGGEAPPADPTLESRSVILNRLIDPPLVAAWGAPNIGKSSLLNALAGRSAAVVADEPGTTRDHVGVRLELAGLVVDYIDTPGMAAVGAGDGARQHSAADPLVAAALGVAIEVAQHADLVLLCADRGEPFLEPPSPGAAALRVALRADLGLPGEPFDAAVSVRTGAGIAGLVRMIRDSLVPPEILAHPGHWRF